MLLYFGNNSTMEKIPNNTVNDNTVRPQEAGGKTRSINDYYMQDGKITIGGLEDFGEFELKKESKKGPDGDTTIPPEPK